VIELDLSTNGKDYPNISRPQATVVVYGRDRVAMSSNESTLPTLWLMLTRTGPDTAAGTLMRRYWQLDCSGDYSFISRSSPTRRKPLVTVMTQGIGELRAQGQPCSRMNAARRSPPILSIGL
jgi:hypothetical protein